MNILNWCLPGIHCIETLLSLKINNIMSGEHAEVKEKNCFLPLNLLSGLTHIYALAPDLALEQDRFDFVLQNHTGI